MPCANEANIRSPGTSEMVVIDLHNIGTTEATLYWIDFQGIRKQYAVIAPGLKLRQETYLGHVWVLARGNDCIKMFGAPKYDGPWPFPFSIDGPPE
jgi:hypothetical protein